MSKLINSIENTTNRTRTANGDAAFKSTKSELLDFFALGGAIRDWTADQQVGIFDKAWGEDPLLAFKTMFFMRDIRGGQGQREAFRNQIRALADRHPDVVTKNLHLIPEYGRWDDVYTLVGTKVEREVLNLIREQFREDINAERPSLMAKWLKSENATSLETKALGTWTRKGLGMSSKQYRKNLSAIRERIKLVESMMSNREFGSIQYEKVPSQAMMKYRKAFARNDSTRFADYVNRASKGEVKINSATLYPHQIIEKMGLFGWNSRKEIDHQLAQAMWDQLPDYLDGREENVMVMVDTSGSMLNSGFGTRPIDVSIALGLYFAERNSGLFKDSFLTFSSSPSLVKLDGKDLVSRVRRTAQAEWGMSTDLRRAFGLILNTAVNNDLSEEDMPTKLVVVSDMQFNRCTSWNSSTFEDVKRAYARAGYQMPKIIFWNVNAKDTQPVDKSAEGVALVSGFSPSNFKYIMGEVVSPYDLMLEVLESERYQALEI